jgi:hypothetical protein
MESIGKIYRYVVPVRWVYNRSCIAYVCRELAHESGVHNWIRVPALNTDASFIADMASLVEEALEVSR